jgi:peptidoglycan/xylan/chitin deacetylase (PgdA/CDA1 family)
MKKCIKLQAILLLSAILIHLAILPCSVIAYSNEDGINDSEVYRKNENQYKKIALTFDDGPHPKLTPKILRILDKYNVKATFFTVGINVHYYPETFEEIVAHGHEIGNHTYTHPHVSRVDRVTLRGEIERCEDEIYEHGEYKTKLFRPPEGMIDNGVTSLIKELDYKVILWDIDTRDWDHTNPRDIAEMVVNKVSSGDIILMHDYISYNSPTPEALELFLPILIEKGYQFVTVSELIGLK